MKALFVADSIHQLHPRTDTSLYFLRELFARKWDCYWATAEEISWQTSEVKVNAHLVLNGGSREDLPQVGSTKQRSVCEFERIIIRKEPPFNESYLRLCWLLAPYEERVYISNRPGLLIRHHEKMLPLEAHARGYLELSQLIPSCISDSVAEATSFVENLDGEHVILKPWLGHGGRDIKLLDRESFLNDPQPHLQNAERWIIQPFEKDIFLSGDRRVLFVGGKYVGDFVRIPKSGHFVSNLVRGGHAELKEMSESEKRLTKNLEKFLKDLEIDFAGADYIASRLSEVNITSPTGLGSFEDLTGQNLAKNYIDYLDEKGPAS